VGEGEKGNQVVGVGGGMIKCHFVPFILLQITRVRREGYGLYNNNSSFSYSVPLFLNYLPPLSIPRPLDEDSFKFKIIIQPGTFYELVTGHKSPLLPLTLTLVRCEEKECVWKPIKFSVMESVEDAGGGGRGGGVGKGGNRSKSAPL